MSEFHFAQARLAASHEIIQIDKRNMRGRYYNPNSLAHMFKAFHDAEDLTAKALGKPLDDLSHSTDPQAIAVFEHAIYECVGGKGMIGEKLVKAIERAKIKAQTRRSR